MWGISNWRPEFVYTTEEILSLCRQLSADVVGERIECSWVAWLNRGDNWWDDAPVIIRANGVNYEICWSKISECAISINTINVHESACWCDCDELKLTWRKDGLPALQSIVGQQINSIHLIEAQVTLKDHSAHQPGWSNSYWMPYGVNFILSDGFLSIYNAFDTNGVTDKMNDYPSPYSFDPNRIADEISASEGFRIINIQ